MESYLTCEILFRKKHKTNKVLESQSLVQTHGTFETLMDWTGLDWMELGWIELEYD